MYKIHDPKTIAKVPNKTNVINRAATNISDHTPLSGSSDHQFPNKSNNITHDFAKTSVFPTAQNSLSPTLKISSPHDASEKAAKQTEEKLSKTSHLDGQSFTENGRNLGKTRLSKTARQFYEPFVGSAVDRAKINIGGPAEELAKLSKANALTHGEDIYIPKNKFSPGSVEGRALIGHELTHVAQNQPERPQVFRDEEEPHYPTIAEQKKIEKLLGRERKPKALKTITDADGNTTEVEDVELAEGKNLTPEERVQLAADLKAPLNSTIDELVKNAEESEKSNPSDIHTEEAIYDMALKARKEIYEEFGNYISRSVTLTKTESSVEERIKEDQILVKFSDMSNAAKALARTLATTHCSVCRSELNGLNSESKSAVVNMMATAAVSERGEYLKKAAMLKVGGSYQHKSRTITLPYRGDNVYHSAVHELIHALAHPAFRAAFGDEDLPNEGFTEYFARQVASGSSYPIPFSKVQRVKASTSGPFLFDYGTGGSAEESLRLAYFSGRLELIGWQPTSKQEEKAVEDAGGSKKWDPDKAKEYAEIYKNNAQEKQDPHNNILGVGVYFKPQSASDPTFTVRYARVLAQTQPYSKGRLLLEGQLIGAPIQNPREIGGSLGIAGEYQEPFFYATGGARFIGAATLQGDQGRVDFSPFAGVGIRAWQRIRVGGEAFVLLPIVGQGIIPGGAVTIGIEL